MKNLPGINISVNPNEIKFEGHFYDTDPNNWVAEVRKKLIPYFVQLKNNPCKMIFSFDYISVKSLEAIYTLISELKKDKKSISVTWNISPSNPEFSVQMGEMLKESLSDSQFEIVNWEDSDELSQSPD